MCRQPKSWTIERAPAQQSRSLIEETTPVREGGARAVCCTSSRAPPDIIRRSWGAVHLLKQCHLRLVLLFESGL